MNVQVKSKLKSHTSRRATDVILIPRVNPVFFSKTNLRGRKVKSDD